jgi:hypothetical protein
MAKGAHREEPAPVELPFLRTLARYLVSIVASLVAGFIWLETGARLLHLRSLATMFTGVLALALGFLAMAYLWLSIDLSRPVPESIDESERNTQLLMLWLGIPLLVILICTVVAAVAVVLSLTVLRTGLPGG